MGNVFHFFFVIIFVHVSSFILFIKLLCYYVLCFLCLCRRLPHYSFATGHIIIAKDTISLMQGIYTYIPETNHVPKKYNVAAILSLLFMVPISLAPALDLKYVYIRTFRSMCAVPNMAVFCSSLTSWFPGMVLTYFLNDFEIIIIIIISLIFIFVKNVLFKCRFRMGL
jgi:hypothetical protein